MPLLRSLVGLGFAARQSVERAVRASSGARSGLRAQYVLDRFLAEARGAGATGRFLEIGCNEGGHTEYVRQAGVFDSIMCVDFVKKHRAPGHVHGDYMAQAFDAPFDAIWTSHVLEHIRNPGAFLDKLHGDLREGGVLALNVPPLKHAITVGHVTLWTPGLLLLNLVKAGFDCSQAAICEQGYNIGVVLTKRSGSAVADTFTPGEPGSARPFLPAGLSWFQKRRANTWYFRGNFTSLNW